MRLFVSYARVDKPYCIHIVNTLDVHDVWYDQRLYAGAQWWKEILRRLEWCEGFVYLLSPDSLASEYCRQEFEIALSHGKHVFPVRIHEDVELPAALREVQYVDLCKGLTPEAVKMLLNSIYVVERDGRQLPNKDFAHQSGGARPPILPAPPVISQTPIIKPPVQDPNSNSVTSLAAHAMENGQYDKAVYLLRQAKANGYTTHYINLDALLEQAEVSLERQTQIRAAEREYKLIVDLVMAGRTRPLGCEAFHEFAKDFPGYDPDCLFQWCGEPSGGPKSEEHPASLLAQTPPPPPVSLPLLEWCDIPGGIVLLEDVRDGSRVEGHSVFVDSFRISKYPITNAQYQCFIDDPGGYDNPRWWQYSTHAHSWRMNNPKPHLSKFKGEERPRETVTWYDAMAFCRWLSDRLGAQVMLPTEAQWQRAAQGDDARRFPWGNALDANLCNVRESGVKMTTLVMRYPEGASPFGVYDMIGNVWEWCLDSKVEQEPVDVTTSDERAVHGGSFVSVHERSDISFRYHLNPQTYYASIGFRIVQNL